MGDKAMKSKDKALKFKQHIDAPVSEVYSAFTNATALCEWLCDGAQADALPGGRLYLWWVDGYYMSGEYIDCQVDERIVFSWLGRGEPGATRVKVTLKTEDSGTSLSLVHQNFKGRKTLSQTRKDFKKGWTHGLENLKSVLETGLDLRLATRPVLGAAGLEVVTPDMALSVKSGLRLQGVVEGLSAQAAGLLKDDILVRIDRQKVASFSDFVSVMQAHSAGDKVRIDFYRGAERMRTKMVLSPRPAPDVPETTEGLVEAVRKIYDQGNAILRQTFARASKEEAAFHPGAKEWSAQDVMAHLIACERETHSWIAGLIEGQGAEFEYHANLPTRIIAILAAFPTVKALFDEFKRNQQETLAMLRAVPPEFVARKRSYSRMGRELLEFSSHYENHVDQIRAALEASRNQPVPEMLLETPAEVLGQPEVTDHP
jgi:uncharacterized protein YndB with AHSA1/START domain